MSKPLGNAVVCQPLSHDHKPMYEIGLRRRAYAESKANQYSVRLPVTVLFVTGAVTSEMLPLGEIHGGLYCLPKTRK